MCYRRSFSKEAYSIFVAFWLIETHLSCHYRCESDAAALGPGHSKPFGHGRPVHAVEEMQGFPDTQSFFKNYVYQSRPLVMKGAAKLSPAYRLWDDEYFLSLDIPADQVVNVEGKKKENRTFPTVEMHFKDFVRVYNKTDQYMVQNVPSFLGQDVLIPGPLQCEPIYKGTFVETIMWFSSGGTKSVVHTDSVDNMNCLYRGEKELYFIDPSKYGEYVDIDHPEGAYSSMDVDSINYTKYPGMAKVEYEYVKMEKGDCLFIPHKWIHQVRSTGRNIAVNIWWDHHRGSNLDLENCPKDIDMTLMLDKAKFHGFDSITQTAAAVKEYIMDWMKYRKQLTFEEFATFLVGDLDLEAMNAGVGYKLTIQEIFKIIDQDKDGFINKKEGESLPEERWGDVQQQVQNFEVLVKTIEDRHMDENPHLEHPPRKVQGDEVQPEVQLPPEDTEWHEEDRDEL